MSDEIKPVEQTQTADVVPNFAEKTLAELSQLLKSLTESEDRMKRSKEAEAIKSAFYKRLSKEKAEAGEDTPVEEPDESAIEQESTGQWRTGELSCRMDLLAHLFGMERHLCR